MKNELFNVQPKDLYPIEQNTIYKLFKLIFDDVNVDRVYGRSHALSSYIKHSNTNYYKNTLYTYSNAINHLTIYNVPKPISLPTIKKILNCLNSENTEDTTILVLNSSPACKEEIRKYNESCDTNYSLKNLVDFIDRDQVDIHQMNGAKASKLDKENITISIRVPKKGFPNLGINHTPTQKDIYKILMEKNIPVGQNSTNPLTKNTLNAMLRSFMKFTNLLNDGKSITNKRWNDILSDEGAITLIDKMYPNGEGFNEIYEEVN